MSNKEAMIRWQDHARESRTAVNTHFLAYSAGILAFQASVLTDNDVQKINQPCIYILVGVLAILSLMIGSTVVLIRLRDTRLTARIARYKDQGASQQDINGLRDKTDFWGKWTNRFIPLQVISFILASVCFIAWLVTAYWDKFV